MTSPVAYWHVADIEAEPAEVTAAGVTVQEPAHDVGGVPDRELLRDGRGPGRRMETR